MIASNYPDCPTRLQKPAGSFEPVTSKFVIDCKGRDLILDANKNRVGEICNKLDAEDKQRDQISTNIKRDCWVSMETHATECRALLKEKVSVANFPLSMHTKVVQRQAFCVCNFRKLELRDIASAKNIGSTTWPGRASMVPGNIDWIIKIVRKVIKNYISSSTTQYYRNNYITN